MNVDEVRSELADIQRRLLDLADDDFAGKHRLLTRRDELRALAAEHRRDTDAERSDPELLSELAARRQQLAAIERQRIDVVIQHGAGSHGTAAGGDGWGAVQLNQAMDQAQDVAGIQARIGRLKAILTDRGVDIPPTETGRSI